MRIAYLAVPMTLGQNPGVAKKVLAHCRTWRDLGHEVGLFVISPDDDAAWADVEPAPMARRFQNRGLRRLGDLMPLRRAIEAWRADLTFFRLTPYYPGVRALMDKIPTVVEINIDDRHVSRRAHTPAKRLYHMLTRSHTLRGAAGLTVITPQLGRLDSRRGRPMWISGNGITLAEHAAPDTAPRNDAPHALFIGTGGLEWHGVDEIVALAARLGHWRFDIVGYAASDVTAPVPGNVHLHGPLTSDRYLPMLRRADVALGPAALHRAGIDEACPLKVREYLANGLPVISTYRDPDLDDAPFVLELPNVAGSLVDNVPQIEAFLETWRGRRVERGDVRHLDMTIKEAERLDFFARIIAATQPPARRAAAGQPALT